MKSAAATETRHVTRFGSTTMPNDFERAEDTRIARRLLPEAEQKRHSIRRR
jgi:hypothetical protein